MNNPSSPRALLVGWANSQDHWVRAIVREVLTTQQEPSQATLDEAYAICLSEKDLSDEPVTPVPSLALDEDPEDRIEALCLTSLKGVQGVNRLVGDQKIIFNPRMTVLFGENATGKSGYVRILKQIAAVRSVEKVLPDINAEPPPSQRAELEFTLDGKPDSATWQGEAGTRPFTRMSIFDTRAVSFHLDDELTYSYTPRDLALFQHVNFGVTAIADRLDEARKEAELGQNPFLSRFRSGSVVYPKIETLSAATDITTLETLANVSDAEAKLVDSYREKIEALNPQLITSRLELAKGNRDLLKSIVAVSATAAEFDPGAYEAALHRRSEASKHHRAATETAFSSYDIPTVLSEAWRHFIVAGDEYLKDLGLEDYPLEGEKCLYCRQELGTAAVVLLRQYRDYCNNTLKKAVDVARAEITAMVADLRAINLPAFQQGVRNKLQQFEGNGEPPPIYVAANDFALALAPVLESTKQFEQIPSSTISDEASELEKLSVATLKEAETSIVTLQQQSKEREAARAEAEQNLRDLEDRLTLRELLPRIRGAVEAAKWAERAKKITTKRFPPLKRSLTDQTKAASEDLLNRDFQRLFERERKALRAPEVRLQFPGKQAAAARRKSLPKDHRLSDVLSEGEQKVIALSDFLAESAIRTSSAPILFDDPVNSLDYRRLEYIVEHFFDLSADHQVIVFTHNIWFATAIIAKFDDHKSAENCSFFNVDLGPDEQPGYISGGSHPRWDTPKIIKGRINELVQEASSATGEIRKALVESAYGRLRGWCEAVAEQELLCGLAMRYQPNIRMGKLQEIRTDRLGAASEVICRIFEKACRIIEAHSQPLETLGTSPSLKDFTDDWEEAQKTLVAYKAPKVAAERA